MTINNIATGINNPHLTGANLGGITAPGSVQGPNNFRPGNTETTGNVFRPPGSQAVNMRNFVSAIRAAGNQMNDAVGTLLNRHQSIWDNLQANSTNADTVSARITDQSQARREATVGSMTVNVTQLAASQQNTGDNFDSRAINRFGRGAQQFSITRGGNTFDFAVEVGVTDSNQTVQQRMADAINRQNIGVSASVETDNAAGTSRLVLTGAYSGANQNFSISDRANSSLVSQMGLNESTRQAQDAIFTVNGTERRTAANDVELGLGISANLRAEGQATISAARDTQGIGNVVNELVNSFNSMHEAASRYSADDMGARTLLQRLDSIAGQSDLRGLGITRGRDGQLTLDRERLDASINNGTAESILSNRQGFAGRLQQIGQVAEQNPETFVSPHNRVYLDGSSPPNNGDSEGEEDSDGERESMIRTPEGRNPINTRFENRPGPSIDGRELFGNQMERDMFAMMVSPQGMRTQMMGMLFSMDM